MSLPKQQDRPASTVPKSLAQSDPIPTNPAAPYPQSYFLHAAPSYAPLVFPMQTYPMPGYPAASMFMPPYPYPIPMQFPRSPDYTRKRRYSLAEPSSNPIDEAEAGITNMAIDYPHVCEWLQHLSTNPARTRDNQDYTVFAQALSDNGVLHLDDITRFTYQDLCAMTGMKMGMAARIIDWAKVDRQTLEVKARKARK